MITEDYVSFETAKLLKEKGLDEYGMYFYTLKDEGREGYKSNKRLGEFAHNSHPELKERAVSCPTLQMAMKWLREKCIFITLNIIAFNLNGLPIWHFVIWRNNNHEYRSSDYFDSYEQACEAAIKYCLENLI